VLSTTWISESGRATSTDDRGPLAPDCRHVVPETKLQDRMALRVRHRVSVLRRGASKPNILNRLGPGEQTWRRIVGNVSGPCSVAPPAHFNVSTNLIGLDCRGDWHSSSSNMRLCR
jgi:hypothetical protein